MLSMHLHEYTEAYTAIWNSPRAYSTESHATMLYEPSMPNIPYRSGECNTRRRGEGIDYASRFTALGCSSHYNKECLNWKAESTLLKEHVAVFHLPQPQQQERKFQGSLAMAAPQMPAGHARTSRKQDPCNQSEAWLHKL